MNKKKKKKTKNPINISELEDKINVLNFMKDDFEKILIKENEKFSSISSEHTSKEKRSSTEKEKTDIILKEFISFCEEKKNLLNKYVQTANEIINKNNEIIENEKTEIQKVISQKNEEIEYIQQKIELTENYYRGINTAIMKLLNNLDLFLKYKMNIELNFDKLKHSSKSQIKVNDQQKENMNTEQKDNKYINFTRQEGDIVFVQELHESMDEYDKKICSIRSFIKKNKLDEQTKTFSLQNRIEEDLFKQLSEGLEVGKRHYDNFDKDYDSCSDNSINNSNNNSNNNNSNIHASNNNDSNVHDSYKINNSYILIGENKASSMFTNNENADQHKIIDKGDTNQRTSDGTNSLKNNEKNETEKANCAKKIGEENSYIEHTEKESHTEWDDEAEEDESEDDEVEDSEVEDSKVEDNEVEDNEVEDNEVEDNEVEDNEVEDNEVEDSESEDNESEDNEVENSEVEDNEVEDSESEDDITDDVGNAREGNEKEKNFMTLDESEYSSRNTEKNKQKYMEKEESNYKFKNSKKKDNTNKKSNQKLLNETENIVKSFSSDIYKKIVSDNINILMDKINKIDYDYISYFEKKLKN
ncbi:conserved Plasmodium protein, unknown function [Plasmodium malariae]|uniref:Uncharacterized protein n=1 Tax=Plasmodium malariae TaxID=5858 RepID=A0A1A8W9C1_PLAMA|nr:conserved Plasmodium protein, unknown function [Plasmodium malariae]